MRQYDVLLGILLALSIIDLALAAPIPAQGNGQSCADVAHIPRDMINMLEKRVDDGLERVVAEYLEGFGPNTPHASSAPPGPEHGSMNDGQAPAPNPAPSTANADPLVEPTSPSSTSTSSVYDGSDTEFWTYWNDLEGPGNQEFRVLHGSQMDDVLPPPQEDGAAHGHQMGHMQLLMEPPSPSSSSSWPSTPSFTSSDLNQASNAWNDLDPGPLEDEYQEVDMLQPDAGPLRQVNDVAHEIQMGGVQQQQPQQNDMANEFQVDDEHQPNMDIDQNWHGGL